ncbi:MAG TPA: hypothetical protein EYP14_07270 [Planctomycetaceae bacterium]|nr:hypothetical protein [Planctomycetaceae bacterium]
MQVCCPQPCPPQPVCTEVERTILVPEWTTETQKVKCIEYRQQVREEKVTVWERVPVKRTVTCQYTEWVREVRKCKQTDTAWEPVWKEVTRTYTEYVPQVVQKKGVRAVWKCVPVKQKRIVCEDKGHWEERVVCACECGRCRQSGPCGDCCTSCCQPTECVQRVWVPKIVQREIETTVMEWRCVEEPYTCEVTVCKPVTRTCKVRVCEYRPVTKTREVSYTVCVPKKRTRSYEVTEYKCVPREKTIKRTVCVPVEVEKEVQVRVCRMVPKKVTVQVPVCEPCPVPSCDQPPCCQ